MNRLREALVIYADAHADRFPGERWCDAIRPYETSLDADLAIDAKGDGVGFAFMPKAVGAKLSNLGPENYILVEYRTPGTNMIARDPKQVFVRADASSVQVSDADRTFSRRLSKVLAQITHRSTS